MKKVQSTNLNKFPPVPPPPTTSDIIHMFKSWKTADGLSENTIRFYEQRLKIYVDFCGDDFFDINSGDLRNLFEIYGKTHKISTTNALFRAVKIFYTWYDNQVGYLNKFDNPMQRLKAPKVPPKVLDPLPLDDFSKMIEYCNTSRRGVMYTSMLYFLLQSGARAQEFLSLDRNDVNLLSGEVHIRFGKGRKQRVVYIGNLAKKSLKTYLKTRIDNEEALWLSSYGERLTYSGLNRILREIAKKAGVKPYTPHAYRRAFCKQMILSGVNTYSIMTLMGWSSYSVLTKYVKLYGEDTRIAYANSGVDSWLRR